MDKTKEYQGFEKKFYDLVSEVIQESTYGIYDLKYISGSKSLRLFILSNNSVQVDIEDCIAVDRMLSEAIENADWIPEAFVLEVSSPGVYRDMSMMSHFTHGLNERVTLTLFTSAPDTIKTKGNKVSGTLLECGDDSVVLKTEDTDITINIEHIKKAQVDPLFEDLKNKATLNEQENRS